MRVFLFLLLLLQIHYAQEETCSELYSKIKTSECGKTVFRYLEDAELKIGFNLNTTSLTVDNKDETTQAALSGRFLPSPVFSLSFPPTYFWITSLGYETSFGFTNLFGNVQTINRGKDTKNADLNTYFSSTMIYVTPTLFYALGGNDDTPDQYIRFGLGIGLGYAWVEGTAFYTEDPSSACYDKATQLLEGKASSNDIFEDCTIEKYDSNGFGFSSRLLLDFRYRFVSLSLNMDFVNVIDTDHSLSPVGLSVGFLYWIKL